MSPNEMISDQMKDAALQVAAYFVWPQGEIVEKSVKKCCCTTTRSLVCILFKIQSICMFFQCLCVCVCFLQALLFPLTV